MTRTHADTLRGMAKTFMMAGSYERVDTCLAGADALDDLAADTLEYGVARPDDEGWAIWWDDQRMQDWGTLDEARENLAKVKRHCPDVRLVCRRVSAQWEVTDE